MYAGACRSQKGNLGPVELEVQADGRHPKWN